jgi:hypothetical protein
MPLFRKFSLNIMQPSKSKYWIVHAKKYNRCGTCKRIMYVGYIVVDRGGRTSVTLRDMYLFTNKIISNFIVPTDATLRGFEKRHVLPVSLFLWVSSLFLGFLL